MCYRHLGRKRNQIQKQLQQQVAQVRFCLQFLNVIFSCNYSLSNDNNSVGWIWFRIMNLNESLEWFNESESWMERFINLKCWWIFKNSWISKDSLNSRKIRESRKNLDSQKINESLGTHKSLKKTIKLLLLGVTTYVIIRLSRLLGKYHAAG